jgi:hypothetical protein
MLRIGNVADFVLALNSACGSGIGAAYFLGRARDFPGWRRDSAGSMPQILQIP